MSYELVVTICIVLAINLMACISVMLDYKKKYKNLSRSISNSDIWYDTDEDKFFCK